MSDTAMSPNRILASLCDPILRSAFPTLDPALQSALKFAPPLMVSTLPPRVVLLAGSKTEPIDLGRYDLPEGAGDALAEFFTAGLANLAVRVQSMVSLALASERAQLMASLSPDRWEAKCYLVADSHDPMLLFTLSVQPELTWGQ